MPNCLRGIYKALYEKVIYNRTNSLIQLIYNKYLKKITKRFKLNDVT